MFMRMRVRVQVYVRTCARSCVCVLMRVCVHFGVSHKKHAVHAIPLTILFQAACNANPFQAMKSKVPWERWFPCPACVEATPVWDWKGCSIERRSRHGLKRLVKCLKHKAYPHIQAKLMLISHLILNLEDPPRRVDASRPFNLELGRSPATHRDASTRRG